LEKELSFLSELDSDLPFVEQFDNLVYTLAEDFYKVVISCGKFSWMGLFETKDELQIPHFVIYLQEEAHPPIQPQGVPRRTTVGKAFAELALALRPKLALAGPYYLTPDGQQEIKEGNTQFLEEEIKRLYKTEIHEPEVRTVWQGILSPG